MRFSALALANFCLTLATVDAHPGHDVQQEIKELAAFYQNVPRDFMSRCASQLKARGHEDRNIARRSAILKVEREKRGLHTDRPVLAARDNRELILNTSHLSPIAYTPDTPADVLFAGNNSCILSPETTEGPYYVAGEYVRSDVREQQAGIDLILDIQVLDFVTCEPLPNIMVDLWYANASGVYSGLVDERNGNGNDASNINRTHSRGLQLTDEHGVVEFTSLFPGHYEGRTTHTHVATYTNGTMFANGTYLAGTASQVGQIYYDQVLTDQVNETPVYAANHQRVITNAVDGCFAESASVGDPIVHYSLLGDKVEDGIFAWIAFGIDTANERTINRAATYTENGGIANPDKRPPPGRPDGPGGPGGPDRPSEPGGAGGPEGPPPAL